METEPAEPGDECYAPGWNCGPWKDGSEDTFLWTVGEVYRVGHSMGTELTIERARVAVVGTQDWTDAQRPFAERRTREYIRGLPAGTLVVSGGARDVDSWAADEARKAGLEVEEHLPEWERYGRKAGAVRNAVIADRCHTMTAIWDGQSRGTKNAIELAHSMMKPVTIIRI